MHLQVHPAQRIRKIQQVDRLHGRGLNRVSQQSLLGHLGKPQVHFHCEEVYLHLTHARRVAPNGGHAYDQAGTLPSQPCGNRQVLASRGRARVQRPPLPQRLRNVRGYAQKGH